MSGVETPADGGFSIGPPASLAGFEDSAEFALVLDEEEVGTVRSTWLADGRVESRSSMSLAGQTTETFIAIAPDGEGRWCEYVSRMPIGTLIVTRQGTRVTRRFGPKTSTYDTPAGAVLFDNDAPLLVTQALRLYDRARGGRQQFPLLLGARAPAVPLAVTMVEERPETGGVRLTAYRYSFAGVDILAWADDVCRVYLLEMPSQRAKIVRRGFTPPRAEADDDPLISPPRYEVSVERGVGLPVRDGVRLSTDIYRPVGVESAPVILARTPYKKELNELQAMFFARRGYVYAAQDCRGRFASEGRWEPFINEGPDGYDSIEWLASQDYANGKVGMIGGSYLGLVQWLAAVLAPPHLAAIIPNVTPPDPFYNIPYEYGAFMLWGALWWSDVIESQASADISGAALRRIQEKKYKDMLRALPVIDLDVAVLGGESLQWRRWIEHPALDDYWEAASYMDRLGSVRVPALIQSGWFDDDGIGSKLVYTRLQERTPAHHKLILGPWGHTDTATRAHRGRDFGEDAIVDLQRTYLRWFDRWLKGIGNGIDEEPRVSLFVMGADRWLHSGTYPPESAGMVKLYLTSGGKANTSLGDGRLTFEPPAAVEPDRYLYDPADPTPDPRSYQESDEDARKVRSSEERQREKEGFHRRLSETRADILVYQTEPLAAPLTIAGPVSAVLHASTSGRDTDWFMTLSEVTPDGKIFRLVQGKLRARYRSSMRSLELLNPGEVYRFTLDLWQVGIWLAPGSRLRLEVASASFPMFSRNLNTGGHNETETEFIVAHQTVFHDAAHPSYLKLPVVDA